MTALLVVLIASGLFYLAYRIIRNGFARSQSEKLNAYGIAVYVVLFFFAVCFVASLAARFF